LTVTKHPLLSINYSAVMKSIFPPIFDFSTTLWIFALGCLMLMASCGKDEVTPVLEEPSDDTTLDVGNYIVQVKSLERIPYEGKKRITFVNSNNAPTVFEISEREIFVESVTFFRYDVFEIGDTVSYSYTTEQKKYRLVNNSLSLSFELNLRAEPFFTDSEAVVMLDVLNVALKDPTNASLSDEAFCFTIDPRSSPFIPSNPPINSVEIGGRIFQNVLTSPLENSTSVMNLNYEFGILSFTDPDGNLWRFASLN